MHLPFLQIDNEVLDQTAPELAIELDAPVGDMIVGLLNFFRWALGRCPDSLPPSRSALVPGPKAAAHIARAAGYQGDPEAFADACCKAAWPILERVPDGLRVRGLDRYDRAWAKNHPAEWKALQEQAVASAGAQPAENRPETGTKPAHSRPETGTKPGRNGAETGPPDADADADAERSLKPPPPASSSKPTGADRQKQVVVDEKLEVAGNVYVASEDDCWRMLQDIRHHNGLKREGGRPKGFGAWFWAAVREVGLEGIFDAYRDFVEDQGIEAKGHPMGVFLAAWDVRKPAPKGAACP